MADLQDGFDWKAVNQMGISFALTGAAAAIGGWAGGKYAPVLAGAIRGVTEWAVQEIRDGEVTSYAGIILAMIPGPAKEVDKNTVDTTKTAAQSKGPGSIYSCKRWRIKGGGVDIPKYLPGPLDSQGS